MLALLFNRTSGARRLIGLLALGEWGPATGKISGTVSTSQAPQQTLANGNIVAPVVGVGGGSGAGVFSLELSGPPLRYVTPKIAAIRGRVESRQATQETRLTGDMVDTELEMVLMALMAVA